MKKILLVITFLLSLQAFGQLPTIKYYGGIYENQLYFNYVLHNKDTCFIVIETSNDGYNFQEIFCDSIKPMPVAISHSFKLPTNEKQLFIKMVIQTDNKVIYFPASTFAAGQYTYNPEVSAQKFRVIRAKF